MKILKFSQFLNEEAISGTELVGNVSMGPAFGDVSLRNNTISNKHTSLVSTKIAKSPSSLNSLTDNLFFGEDYAIVLNDYLKSGGRYEELTDDKSLNLEIMNSFLQNKHR